MESCSWRINPESLREDSEPTREILYVDIGNVDSEGRILAKEPMTFATSPGISPNHSTPESLYFG